MLLLARPQWPWLALGALLGVIAIGSNIALMGLSAYLISKAAIATSVAELALAVTGVRVLAMSRAGFRYLERLATHRGMFKLLTTMRVWFYDAVEPLAPARLQQRRSGDLLTRSVADVDALEDFYVRVVVPPIVAAAVIAGMSVLYGVFDLAIGLALASFLLLTGVLLPLATRWLSAAPAASMAAIRGVTLTGLKVVGLILIVALLIIPAVAARMWSDRAGVVAALAGAIGGAAGYGGAAVSASAPDLPTGPIIVLLAFAGFSASFFLGAARGVLPRAIRRARMRARLAAAV